MQLTWPSNSSIGIVGAGASGTLVAIRLLDEANRRQRRLDVHLIDPRRATGNGVAYSTRDSRHLLNVQARGMSAYGDDPHHFLRWLERDTGCEIDPCSFVPRMFYGRYLDETLAEAARRAPWARLHRRHERVVDAEPSRTRCALSLAGGDQLAVDAVVLALGCVGSATAWVPDSLARSPRFVADPWADGALASVDDDRDVLVVGAGLTMVDIFRTLDRPGRVVHAISRRGRMPARHRPGIPPRMEAPELPAEPTLEDLRAALQRHIAKARDRYGDWRPAVDSIRAMTPKLWAGLSTQDRKAFLAHDVRVWETLRHRIPPRTGDAVDDARAAGRLTTRRGTVVTARETGDGIAVSLSDGTTLQVGTVVNCTGLADAPASSSDPLVRKLLETGRARTGPLGLGLDTTAEGRVRDRDGKADGVLWTLGPLRRGDQWETTAIPEIRVQAAEIAAELVGVAEGRQPAVRDVYGLPLSTTAEAAAAWNRAVDAIRLLHGGAEAALREAVAADPGFALGHAALALLGREAGADVDVSARLERACLAAKLRGNPREQSFVRMVEARVLGTATHGDRVLRRHLLEHPLDALAVSVALPTIAFGGLAQPEDETWAIAERLAPSYGDDWWFTGVLAFFRQQQGRWDDAERLAVRSMAAQPASGHAAHARTHVYYETGEHQRGVSWLDGWIEEQGPRSLYRSHFSWHAALHELALDDAAAVRARYDAQLAPPSVTGARALVDSASLLWRSRLADCWPGEQPVAEVIAAAPECLLDRPATPFAALHAVVALAAAGNAEGIDRVRAAALATGDEIFCAVIVPACDGFAAHVRGDYARAAAALGAVRPRAHELGGSAAQQEVLEDTLIDALVRCGRCRDAARVLDARLDRRPHPNDARRLAQVGRTSPRT